MSDEAQIRAREGRRGAVDVWVEGWHLHFPGKGGKPAPPSRALPPPDLDREPLPAKLAVYREAEGITVRCGDWFAQFGGGEPIVTSALLKSTGMSRFLQRVYHYPAE